MAKIIVQGTEITVSNLKKAGRYSGTYAHKDTRQVVEK
jgi:hypothetical protein